MLTEINKTSNFTNGKHWFFHLLEVQRIKHGLIVSSFPPPPMIANKYYTAPDITSNTEGSSSPPNLPPQKSILANFFLYGIKFIYENIECES